MTEEEYYAAVHRLGLRQTQGTTMFVTTRGELQRVPLAANQTAEQRRETIEQIKICLGVGSRRED
jgi:hypothetical protein